MLWCQCHMKWLMRLLKMIALAYITGLSGLLAVHDYARPIDTVLGLWLVLCHALVAFIYGMEYIIPL